MQDKFSKEAQNELDKIEEIEQRVNTENSIYKTDKYIYNFHHFKTIRTFGRNIQNHKITIDEVDKDKI